MEKFEKELDQMLLELEELKRNKILSLKEKYKELVQFKIGDIIKSTVGILIIESIDFDVSWNGRGDRLPIYAIYRGPKLKYISGGNVTRVSNGIHGKINDYGNLTKIDKTKLV